MRPIKFRVWNPHAKSMYPAEHFALRCSDGSTFQWMPDCEHFKQPFIENNAGNQTFMQFTGLTDKHGTDIYEGDILEGKLEFGDDEGNVCEDMTKICKDVVVFGEYMGRAAFKTPNITDKWSACEIIGNIHQHPEKLVRS